MRDGGDDAQTHQTMSNANLDTTDESGYDYTELGTGDTVVLDAEWDEGVEEREFEFVGFDGGDVVVRDSDGAKYRFASESPYFVERLGECFECGQSVWRTIGDGVEVDVPSLAEEGQMVLDDI